LDEGMYIYCIAKEPFKEKYSFSKINGFNSGVYTIHFRDIGAVVSTLPSELCKVTATRKNMLAHQEVMEEIMRGTTILPVKFGTVAEVSGGEEPENIIKSRVLDGRYRELSEALSDMESKIELGLKALWSDMKTIYSEIVDGNPRIDRLRNKVNRLQGGKSYQSKITLGRLVKDALDEKRAREASAMMNILKELCQDYRENNTFGDNMILNAAFLVKSELEGRFDAKVEELVSSENGRVVFRYLGPVPPSNFVELVITLG
jgi:hypothetical protein